MEEPDRLQSMGSLRVGHNLSDFTFPFHFHALEKEMATHSIILAWRIPRTAEPGGLLSMGSHRVRHDWSNLAAAASYEVVLDKGICISGGEQKVTYFAGILWDLKIKELSLLFSPVSCLLMFCDPQRPNVSECKKSGWGETCPCLGVDCSSLASHLSCPSFPPEFQNTEHCSGVSGGDFTLSERRTTWPLCKWTVRAWWFNSRHPEGVRSRFG